MRDIEITKREVLVSIIILLLMTGFGFFISTTIHNKVSVSNEKYFKALKVDNDENLFKYVIDTEIGDLISYGTLKANEPVSDPLIDGQYFSIKKIEEHYVKKTRTVTYRDSEGNTKTRTETYWEWDVVKRERFDTYAFNYLGKDFDLSTVKIDNHNYNTTVKKGFGGNVRWKFYTIPKEFNASLYSKAESKTIKQNEIYPEERIETLIAMKEKGADNAVIAFWIAWIILTLGSIGVFVALDNRYINNQ